MENKTESAGISRGVIITVVSLFVVLGIALVFFLKAMTSDFGDKTAKIYQDGQLIHEIDLNTVAESYTIKIDSENGHYNIVRVENGRICVSEASCPDKICVNTGYITNNAVPITCLPNKLIIKIEGDEQDGEPDVIVN